MLAAPMKFPRNMGFQRANGQVLQKIARNGRGRG